MTSTTSFKTNLKHSSAVFLWTLRNNIAVIVIYLSLIAFSAIMSVIYGFTIDSLSENSGLSNSFSAASVVSSAFNYSLIIGLVICIRSFSSLPNKRQTDMIGSLPVFYNKRYKYRRRGTRRNKHKFI